MIVAFPSNNQQTIASHIGLAKGFLIVDTSTNEKFYIENPIMQKIQEEHINLKNSEEGHRGLGTGRVIPPLLAKAGVDIFVSRDFGEGMIRNLEFEGIKAFETDKKDIEEVLNQIKDENMRKITKFENNDFENEKGFGYGRNHGFGKRCQRGLGHKFRRGFGARDEKYFANRGNNFKRGLRHRFGREWED